MNSSARLGRYVAAALAAVMLAPVWVHADEAKGAVSTQPEFKPGIPGMRMVDVRDYKFLWYEINELQDWERTNRISVAEYRNKAIEKTVHFLELEGDSGETFTAAAAEAVANVRESFRKYPPVGEDRQFSSDLEAAVGGLNGLLGEAPRHQLFAPECKKWLLKLAFGPREAKEAKEAKQAQAATSDR